MAFAASSVILIPVLLSKVGKMDLRGFSTGMRSMAGVIMEA